MIYQVDATYKILFKLQEKKRCTIHVQTNQDEYVYVHPCRVKTPQRETLLSEFIKATRSRGSSDGTHPMFVILDTKGLHVQKSASTAAMICHYNDECIFEYII